MAYQIEFFNSAVESEILNWPTGVAASFAAIAVRKAENGANLGLPYTRAMGDGLFEIRARGAEGIGRAFFCTRVGKRIVILHGFIKKTAKTPDAQLKIARKRLKEVMNEI